VPIVVEKNTPLTPLKRGIKKTPESYPLDKEKNQKKRIINTKLHAKADQGGDDQNVKSET